MLVHKHGPTVHRCHPEDPQMIGCWEERASWFDRQYEPVRRAPVAILPAALAAWFMEKKVFLCRVEGCWPGRGTSMVLEAGNED